MHNRFDTQDICCQSCHRADSCNGVQREHNKKLNNGLPILHKVPPKRDYGRYFCIMAEKGGTSHGGLTEKLSPFFHAKKQEVNAYGRGSSRTTPSGRLTAWNVSSRCPAKSPPSFKRSPLSCKPCGNRAKKSRRSRKRKLRPAGMPSGKPRATLARGFLFPETVRGPPG